MAAFCAGPTVPMFGRSDSIFCPSDGWCCHASWEIRMAMELFAVLLPVYGHVFWQVLMYVPLAISDSVVMPGMDASSVEAK